LKEHNRRLVLRSVFTGAATSRAALAQHTGLTKPTISDIVSDLIDEGFLVETGHGASTESGGKRPRLLEFAPTARQIIGISVNEHHAFGVLANLDGTIVLRHYAKLDGAHGEAILHIVQRTINGLIAQLDAPLLCIGISTPGIVDAGSGLVRAAHTLGWRDLPLARDLEAIYATPVYVGNSTELATRAQLAFGTAEEVCNLVTIVVNAAIEIGTTFGGATYHHSGDLGQLRPSLRVDQPLSAYLGWHAIAGRIDALRAEYPDTLVPIEGASYLHLRYGYAQDDPLSRIIYDETAAYLGNIFAWIAGLLRPEQIVLAGDIVDMGDALLELAIQQASGRLPPELLDTITFSLSEDPTLNVTGTLAFALHKELGVL
jgi:predicted NBD/HSP70 family sugar kinase